MTMVALHFEEPKQGKWMQRPKNRTLLPAAKSFTLLYHSSLGVGGLQNVAHLQFNLEFMSTLSSKSLAVTVHSSLLIGPSRK